MKRATIFSALCGLGISAMTAQTFFSVNAGTDGFNFNITNVPPLFPGVVAPAPPPPVYAPLLPGVVYEDYAPAKAYRKAAKRYRKAVRHAAEALPVMFFPGVVYYDDDDIEDFYEDYYENYYKHHHHHKVKHYKKHKHHKHHKHHHHDDD